MCPHACGAWAVSKRDHEVVIVESSLHRHPKCQQLHWRIKNQLPWPRRLSYYITTSTRTTGVGGAGGGPRHNCSLLGLDDERTILSLCYFSEINNRSYRHFSATCARWGRTTGPLSPYRFEACNRNRPMSCTHKRHRSRAATVTCGHTTLCNGIIFDIRPRKFRIHPILAVAWPFLTPPCFPDGGRGLGCHLPLAKRAKRRRLETSGPPTLPGVSSCPTTERARHSKLPAGALRFCAPSAHFGGYRATTQGPTRANPMASPSKGTWKAAVWCIRRIIFIPCSYLPGCAGNFDVRDTSHNSHATRTSRNLNSQHHYHRLAPR